MAWPEWLINISRKIHGGTPHGVGKIGTIRLLVRGKVKGVGPPPGERTVEISPRVGGGPDRGATRPALRARLSRWQRFRSRTRKWFTNQTKTAVWASGILTAIGLVFLLVGLCAGNEGGALADDGFAVNLIATLTTAPFGLAALTLIYSNVTAEQQDRRELQEARAVAGRLASDMLDTLLDPVAESAQLPADWRLRSIEIIERLAAVRGNLTDLRGVAGRLLRASILDPERNTLLRDLKEHHQNSQARWKEILAPEKSSDVWRKLAYQWSILEGDIRTRLLAADDWIADEAAIRMAELVRSPYESLADGDVYPFIDILEVNIAPDEANTYVDVHTEQINPDFSSGSSGMWDWSDRGALQAIMNVAASSLRYVDQLHELAVQISDLATVYPPPRADGLREAAERSVRGVRLGELSGLPVPDREHS